MAANRPLTKNRTLPVELYRWETKDDTGACEDCLERAGWPPMDIADWMKEGLPGTPEAQTECGDHCRCRLIPLKPHIDIFHDLKNQ